MVYDSLANYFYVANYYRVFNNIALVMMNYNLSNADLVVSQLNKKH